MAENQGEAKLQSPSKKLEADSQSDIQKSEVNTHDHPEEPAEAKVIEGSQEEQEGPEQNDAWADDDEDDAESKHELQSKEGISQDEKE